jgi:hypothetical protein
LPCLYSHTPRATTGAYADRLRQGEASGESGQPTHLKGLAVARPPTSFLSGRLSAGPEERRSEVVLPPARIGTTAPPMPDGEEYDSHTEAERQAAWEEYYRVMQMSGAVSRGDTAAGHMVDHIHQYQDAHGTGGYLDE